MLTKKQRGCQSPQKNKLKKPCENQKEFLPLQKIKQLKTKTMKNTMIIQLENVIDQIQTNIETSLDRDEVCMLVRAKQESMVLLRTLTYIYQ